MNQQLSTRTIRAEAMKYGVLLALGLVVLLSSCNAVQLPGSPAGKVNTAVPNDVGAPAPSAEPQVTGRPIVLQAP